MLQKYYFYYKFQQQPLEYYEDCYCFRSTGEFTFVSCSLQWTYSNCCLFV